MWLTEIWGFVVKGSEEMVDGGTENNGLWRTGFSMFEVRVVGQEKREEIGFLCNMKEGKVSI